MKIIFLLRILPLHRKFYELGMKKVIILNINVLFAVKTHTGMENQ
jgi:hypothetical protein